MLFLKALLRQSKIRLLFMINCFKRLLCFFSNRRKSIDDDNQVEIIGSHQTFVVVQTGDNNNKFPHSINDDEIGDGGTIDNRNFPIDSSFTSQQQQQQQQQQQNISSYNRDNLNYSSHSLTSLQQQQKLNSIALSSRGSSQPQPPLHHIPSNDPRQSNLQQQQQEVEEPEPDYFQDMIPQFKKPKTIYVSKDVDSSDVSKKFRVSDRMMVDLDEKKFTQFGTLDDQYGGNHQQMEPESTWEDMAAEEGAWDNIDQSLEEFRREKRERRIREHEQQKMLKLGNNNNNNNNNNNLGPNNNSNNSNNKWR